jgi:hypothetical protein
MGDPFDVIPFEVGHLTYLVDKFTHTILKDIQGDWSKLGSGSFGNVYKGERLVSANAPR